MAKENKFNKLKKELEERKAKIEEVIPTANLNEKEKRRFESLKNDVKKRQEKAEAIDYRAEANSNPLLQRNHLRVVNSNKHTFFKVLAVLFIVFLFGSSGFFGWATYTGKLDGIIQTNDNITVHTDVDINNDYKFNPTTNNEFNDNHTIIINNYWNCTL